MSHIHEETEVLFTGMPEALDSPEEPGPLILDGDMSVLDIIELLNHLKHLAEELPEKDMNTFMQSNIPEMIESLIDSLRNLDIIKV